MSLIAVISLLYAIISYHYVNEKKIIRDIKSNGTYQEKIKKRPYVSRFIEYLRDIENKSIKKIWDEMISEKRKKLFSDDMYSFECDHRFTHSYEIKYIIPISEDKSNANFWALIEFKDLVADNEVRKIKAFSTTEIKDFITISDDTEKVQGHQVWNDVVMVKESKIWKVEEFHTIAISRWK
jgi:hypothetical protein